MILAMLLAAAATSGEEPQTYTLEVMATDAAAVALVVGGLRAGKLPVATAGLGVYLLGGPSVHWAHGSLRGNASFLLRLGLPLAGALTLAALAPSSHGGEEFISPATIGALTGFTLGGAIAMATDWIFLSRDNESAQPCCAMGLTGRAFTLAGRF